MREFKTLTVWQKSHQLTLKVYQLTANYPKEELYGLVSQMRRSASSIPTNIAEGCGRTTQPQMAQFLNVAIGSSSELRYQLILSRDLNYLSDQNFKELFSVVDEVMKKLTSLHQKVSSAKS